jgi:hypothetical protein
MPNINENGRNGKPETRAVETSDIPFLQLNKNFSNYPLARDARVSLAWRKSERTGRWLADLPGNPRIQLRLPEDVDERLKRPLTGFDMKVLFALQRLAHVHHDRIVTLASAAALLKEMRLNERDSRHHNRLKAALALWAKLTIRFGCWYDAGDCGGNGRKPSRGQGRMNRILPPLIRRYKAARKPSVEISVGWHAFRDRYFVKVRLPLPVNEPQQNLILWLHSAVTTFAEDGYRCTQPKTRRQLCRIVGINHKSRNRILMRAIEGAKRWFKLHGGVLDILVDNDDGIVFLIKNPPIPRPEAEAMEREIVPIDSKVAKVKSKSLVPKRTAKSRPRPAVPDVKILPAKDLDGRRCYNVELADGTTLTDDDYAESIGMTVVEFRDKHRVLNRRW